MAGMVLPAWHAALLCHSCVLFLESVAQSLRALHVLVYASHNTALLARSERLAFEAVDTVIKALLDKIRVHLRTVSGVIRYVANDFDWVASTFINSFICFFSMRFCSSRCSLAVSLANGQRVNGEY